jgi:taurine dioxygenase
MTKRQITITPIAGALGAEIGNVDLSALDDESFAQIHQAFLEHLVLFFRDQDLSIEAQRAFGERFSALYVHPYVTSLPGYPDVIQIVKEPEDKKNFGGSWHADLTYLENPTGGAVLYALEVPREGGDTLFANMYRAYAALSPGLQRLLKTLVAVHDDRKTSLYEQDKIRAMGLRDVPIDDSGKPLGTRAEHPLIRTHPETGQDALFVNSVNTTGLKDMSDEESHPLLDYLYNHLNRPEFTCRFRWAAGSVALWDNRCTQHLALNDYQGHRRVMRRVLFTGERPYSDGSDGP